MSSTQRQVLPTLAALDAFATRFIERWPTGATVALQGELGAGKTAFVKACMAALAHAQGIAKLRVVSPTYVLHQSYPELRRAVEHFDLYRMDSVTENDLVEIGFWDAMGRAQTATGFVFVEWAERLDDGLVRFDTTLTFSVDETGLHSVQA